MMESKQLKSYEYSKEGCGLQYTWAQNRMWHEKLASYMFVKQREIKKPFSSVLYWDVVLC